MVEIFETIMQYPLQFIAGLGISAGTVFGIVKFLSFVIGLITKKSKKAKELLQQQNIANAVLTAIGGVDGFCNKVADIVIGKITNNATINEFKLYLEKLMQKDECPIELKAYIQTVLSQTGSEQLHLLYEQTKQTLLEAAKQQIGTVIADGTEKLEEYKETEQAEVASVAQPAPKALKSNKKESDIDYA